MDHRTHHLPPPQPHPYLPNLYFPRHPPPSRPPPPKGPSPSQLFRPPHPPPHPHHQPIQYRPNHEDRRRHNYPVPELSFPPRYYCEEPSRIPLRPMTRRPVDFDDRVSQRVHINRPTEFDRDSQRLLHNHTVEFDGVSQRLLHNRPVEFDLEPQRLHHHPLLEFDRDHQRQRQLRPIEYDQDHQRLQHRHQAEFDQEQGQRLHQPRPLEFDQERHRLQVQFSQDQRNIHCQQQVDLRSMSPGLPVDRFSRHGSAEGTFRTRFEFDTNGDGGNLREETLMGCRDEFPRLSCICSDSGRGFSHGSLSSGELVTNIGSYDDELFRNVRGGGMSEIQRFDHGRIAHKDLCDSMVERRDCEIEREDGPQVFSEKDEYYSSDLGRYNTTEGREISREIKHSPNKQLQKKSAFLRIQMTKPTYRNRDHDRLHYTGYPNNTNSRSPYRGKGHLVEKRSSSPMELDVSFKSNALIAKAMSSVPSDTCLTPRSTKIRKVMDSSRDSSSIHSKEEKLKDSDVGNMLGSGSQPGSSKTDVPTLRSVVVLPSKEMLSDKGDNNTGTRSSSKVKRKKKIVKKVISRPRLSTLQSTKSQGESAAVDNSTQGLDKISSDKCTISIKERNNLSGNGLLEDVNLQPCVSEQALLPDMDKVYGSSQAARLADCGTDVISSMKSGYNIEVVKNTSDVASSSLNGRDMEAPNGSAIADISSCGLAATSNFDVDSVNLSCDNTKPSTNGMECLTKQFLIRGDPSAYENTMEEQPKTSLSSGGTTDYGSSSSENVNKNSCFVYNRTISDLGFQDASVNSIGKNVISEVDAVGNGNNSPCTDNFSTSINTTAGVGILKSASSSPISIALSCSEETRIHNCLLFADNCNHRIGTRDLENTCANLVRNPIPIGESTNDSDQQYPTTPLGTVVEGTNDDSVPTDRKFRNEVDISRTDNVCFGPSYAVSDNTASPSQEIDTTLSIFVKSPGPSEGIVSGFESMSADLQPSRDRFSILDWNNSADLSGDKLKSSLIEPDGCSSGHETRLKDSASGLGSSTANAHDMSEELLMADASLPTANFPSDDEIGITQPKVDVAATSTDAPEGAQFLLEDNQIRGSSEAVAAVRHDDADDNLQLNIPCINSYSLEEKAISDVIPCKEHASVDVPVTDQGEEMDMDNGVVEKFDLPASDEGIMDHNGISENQEPRHEVSAFGLGCESYLKAKNGFPSESNNFSSFINAAMAPKADLNNEVEHAHETMLNLGSPETSSHVPPMQFNDRELTSNGLFSGGNVQEDEKELDEKQVIGSEQMFSLSTSSPQDPSFTTKDHAVENEDFPSQKTMTLFPSDSKSMVESLNRASAEQYQEKIKPIRAFPKAQPERNMATSTHIGKAHTWHRDESAISLLSRNKPSLGIFPMQKKNSPGFGNLQSTSYIRKGNSLLRKVVQPSTLAQNSSIYRMNASLSHDLKKITTSENRACIRTGDVDSLDIARRGGVNALSERPKTPPLLSNINALSPPVPILSECTPSSVEDASDNCCKSTSVRTVSTETNNMSGTFENALKTSEACEDHINSVCNPGSQIKVNEKDSTLNIGSLIYVKRKSNQLVAASSDLSVQGMEKSQALVPDSYYKKSKNQLIRTSDDNLNFKTQRGSRVATERNCGKNNIHKVITKRHRMSKLPLVWTLCGARSSKSDGASLHRSSVFPNLFPWKRATYWRSFMQNSTSFSNKSLSTRKRLLSRKMDMIYTRSVYGYSIQKSKVLSIGGSNLKWSKSMETRPKISNKQGTLTAAASEKKKKGKNGGVSVISGTKNRDRSSRERIFRIGSFRYKMDPSKRTLQRIPDEESSESADRPLEKNAKQSYVPRRLVIGSDEYVRIGNGNQLVRDPKKRLRVLASEKVRWSLHTVRQRLAKKRKYCQFFTRFGKCNKDDGKCPYIHDPSKVSVCTKFLNGLCANPNCKLTHKVIPERMPDCSYFLQGLCANKDCPYRHVNTHPDAPTCEGFLRGYCVDGDECQKKHSYVCPTFEITGSCPQGSKCKLHHPKNRTRGKKRKRSGEQDKSNGRYFGTLEPNISEHGTAVMQRNLEQNDGDGFFEGCLPDYIPLDISSDDETGKDFKRCKQMTYSEDVLLDMQVGSGDIKDMILPRPKLTQQ